MTHRSTILSDRYERILIQTCSAANFSVNDVTSSLKSVSEEDADSRTALEVSLRRACATLTTVAGAEDAVSTAIKNLFELSLTLAEVDRVDPSLPFLVIEDALELSLLSVCERIFNAVKLYSPRLAAPKLLILRCRLVLLRFCNSLLRRLSKTVHTAFCGSVLALLSAFNSVDERGGLNLAGKANIENRTIIEDESVAAQIEELGVDREFYRKVWIMQSAFSDPLGVIASKPLFDTFTDSLHVVLTAFAQSPLDSPLNSHAPSVYFPKYLSGSRLLNLQLQDPSFRRQLLTQSLILIQFITNNRGQPNATIKAVSESGDTEIWKSTAATFVTAQLETVRALLPRVLAELRATPASSPAFAASLLDLLAQESSWIRWKKEKAPAICKSAASLDQPLTLPVAVAKPDQARKKRKRDAIEVDMSAMLGIGDTSIPRDVEGRAFMGSEKAAALFGVLSNADSISDGARNFTPALDTQLDPLIEEEEERRSRPKPADGEDAEAEEDDESYLQRSNKLKAWKLMRVIRRTDHSLFVKSEGVVKDAVVFKLEQRGKEANESMKDEATVEAAPIAVSADAGEAIVEADTEDVAPSESGSGSAMDSEPMTVAEEETDGEAKLDEEPVGPASPSMDEEERESKGDEAVEEADDADTAHEHESDRRRGGEKDELIEAEDTTEREPRGEASEAEVEEEEPRETRNVAEVDDIAEGGAAETDEGRPGVAVLDAAAVSVNTDDATAMETEEADQGADGRDQ